VYRKSLILLIIQSVKIKVYERRRHMEAMFSVVIGRFQPPHREHFRLFEEALHISKKLIVVLGSTSQPRSVKNPFTYEERKGMILAELTERGHKKSDIHVLDVPDSFYSENVWVANVQAQVMSITKGNQDIVLVGHFKDDSSYYLSLFPVWKFHDVEKVASISSSDIRKGFFTGVFDKGIPSSVGTFLQDFMTLPEYDTLVEEYVYITKYQKMWEGTPFPVNHVTVDGVILRSGHVLLVRRGESPGKGNYALPGGFVGTDETLLEACIREVYEETNLTLLRDVLREKLVDTKVFDYPTRSLRGRVITHAHFFDMGGGSLPIISGGSDASAAEWKPLNWIFANSDRIHEDHLSIISYFVMRGK